MSITIYSIYCIYVDDNMKETLDVSGESAGHYEPVEDLSGTLWYPEEKGAFVEGVFMETRPAKKIQMLDSVKGAS